MCYYFLVTPVCIAHFSPAACVLISSCSVSVKWTNLWAQTASQSLTTVTSTKGKCVKTAVVTSLVIPTLFILFVKIYLKGLMREN